MQRLCRIALTNIPIDSPNSVLVKVPIPIHILLTHLFIKAPMNSTHPNPILTSVPHSLSEGLSTLNTEELMPPISRWLSLGGWALVSTIGIAIGVSAVARYQVAVKAEASLRPAGELRVVQSELEGAVQSIQAKENQSVRQGDVITVLDDSKLQAQKSQLQSSIQQNQLQLGQLDAQIRLMTTQVLAESRAAEQAIAAVYPEISRSQSDYQERKHIAQADFEEAQATLNLAQDQLARHQQLVVVGAISQAQFQEYESAVQTAMARVERVKASLNPSQAAVSIAQWQLEQQQSRGTATIASLEREKKSLMQRQSEIQSQILRDQKELEQVERSIATSVIRATSDGIIFQLSLLNPGQIVRPGENIAQIAPTDAPLIVKASVPNAEINKVAVGQTAQMRISACPYTDYGTLKGTVTAIAPDTQNAQAGTAGGTAQTDRASGNNRTFTATIQIDSPVLSKGGRECSLQAGMEATASIISRSETFLQFVLRKLRLSTGL